MIVCGVDEAGRGPVIGPLVICAASFDQSDLEILESLGVKDSKLLSKKRREELSKEIMKLAKEVLIKKIKAKEIDMLREKESLNVIEIKKIAELLNSLKERPGLVVIDAPDVKAERVADEVRKNLKFRCKVIAKHGADRQFIFVSAASIVAKVFRDREIEMLEKKIGMKIGSGYPHDPVTREFLREWIRKGGDESFLRKSWKTYVELKYEQKRLSDF